MDILLVEDDYVDVESIKRLFKKWNVQHRLHIAHNGTEALNMLTREKNKIEPEIILLDINMPKMNGLELLGIIKSYYNLKSIKIFVTTTSGEDYEKLVARNLGVEGYLIKPLTFGDKTAGDALKLKALLLDENQVE